MSLEKMIESATIDVDKELDTFRAKLEKKNEQRRRYFDDLKEVYNKLISETDENKIYNLEDSATRLAEVLEIEFVYVRHDGRSRTYTPEVFWEPSGGCEWVESAQYGYDYGWNVR